ncbi:MAG: thioredoxin family protein [Leucobacter sp.]|nr:thioredoxin family protein [Leucobacter sp.]
MFDLGYEERQPTREEIGALEGAAIVIFGTNWCGYCRAAHRVFEQTLADYPEIQVIKVEDGKGRPLGRFFRVKLWPTMVVLRDGVEVARAVRPNKPAQILDALSSVI